MYVELKESIEINDAEQPAHDEHVDEYGLRKQAKEILTSQLVQMAINFTRTKNTDEFIKFVDGLYLSVPRKPEPGWAEKADEDAKYFIKDYLTDEIVEQFMMDGEIGEDIRNDFSSGDSAFHEAIVDRDYDTQEATDLVYELSEFEETDTGLWEGKDWEAALAMKAAFTYGNAVYDKATDILNDIREEIDMDELDEKIAQQMYDDETITKNLEPYELEEFREMDPEMKVDFVKENFEDQFNDRMEKELKKIIKEIIKEA